MLRPLSSCPTSSKAEKKNWRIPVPLLPTWNLAVCLFLLTFSVAKAREFERLLDAWLASYASHGISAEGASSILENDKFIFIDMNIFHGFFGFFFLLTDYIDNLFAKRFAYARKRLNPSEA